MDEYKEVNLDEMNGLPRAINKQNAINLGIPYVENGQTVFPEKYIEQFTAQKQHQIRQDQMATGQRATAALKDNRKK